MIAQAGIRLVSELDAPTEAELRRVIDEAMTERLGADWKDWATRQEIVDALQGALDEATVDVALSTHDQDIKREANALVGEWLARMRAADVRGADGIPLLVALVNERYGGVTHRVHVLLAEFDIEIEEVG